jgi:hypothetical protein
MVLLLYLNWDIWDLCKEEMITIVVLQFLYLDFSHFYLACSFYTLISIIFYLHVVYCSCVMVSHLNLFNFFIMSYLWEVLHKGKECILTTHGGYHTTSVYASNLLFDVVNQTFSLLSQARGMHVTKQPIHAYRQAKLVQPTKQTQSDDISMSWARFSLC